MDTQTAITELKQTLRAFVDCAKAETIPNDAMIDRAVNALQETEIHTSTEQHTDHFQRHERERMLHGQ